MFSSTLSSCLAASQHLLGLPANSPNPFTINTYKNRISNSFRMNTYRKTGGRGATPTLVPALLLFPSLFALRGNSTLFFSSLRALFAQKCRGVPKLFVTTRAFREGPKMAFGPLRQFVLCPRRSNARKYRFRFTPSTQCEGPKEPAVQDFSYDTHFDL